MSRIKRLAKEGTWIAIGQVATVTGSLVLVSMLTHYLSPAQFGQLALGLTIATLVNQVAMGGITAGIGRFYSIALEKGDLLGYLRTSKRLMYYSTIVTCTISLAFIVGLYSTNQLQWMGLVAAVLVTSLLNGYNSAFGSIQSAARQRANVALHSGTDAWLKIGLAVVAIWLLGPSSTAVVLGYAVSALLVTVSQLFFLRRLLRNTLEVVSTASNNDWAMQMWRFSWPLMAGGLFNWGYYASQRWALELFVTTADVGKFYALTQIAYAPLGAVAGLFMSMLGPILYARAADPKNQASIENVKNIVFKIAAVGVGATFLIAGISSIWHEMIFKIFVAEQYRDVSGYMPLVVIAAGLLQSSIALGIIFTSNNKTKAILPLAIYGQMLIALVNMIMTYYYGLSGLILSMIFGAGLHITWMFRIIAKDGKSNYD
jgi:O-antigen/teichoic acid export membrane protein